MSFTDPKVFRTATGQTGTDAYFFMSAMLANKRRALDTETSDFIRTMASEIRDDHVATHTMGAFSREIDADGIRRMLEFAAELGNDVVALDAATEIARTLHTAPKS